MKWTFLRASSFLCLALCVVISTGCSGKSDTAPVRGKVSYKGKSVPYGTVTFIPIDGGPPATGEIQGDGSFEMTTYSSGDGAILGKHRVVIIALEDNSGKLPEQRNPLPAPIIPQHYGNSATSKLTFQVKEGENTPNFELED